MADLAFFVDEKGPYAVPTENALAEEQSGARPASPEEVAEFHRLDQRAKTYGTTGQAVLASGEAAARALTLGLSTGLETALGVDPEAIAAREAENPLASGIGTAVGVAAPLVLSGGTSALAQGAKLTAPSLVSRAGRAVVGAAERALPEASGLAGQIARKAAAEGLGSAIEGAAFGAGEVVHEAALGDPNLTAQSALATVGTSALLGGAAGGVFGGGAAVGRGIIEKIAGTGETEIGKKLVRWIEDFEGERNLKAAGGIQSDIAKLEKTVGADGARSIGREMRDYGLIDAMSTPAKVAERAAALKAEVAPEIGSILRRADEMATPEAMVSVPDLLASVREKYLAPLSNNPGLKDVAAKFGTLLDDFEEKFAAEYADKARRAYLAGMPKARVQAFEGKITLEATHDLRMMIDDLIPYGKEPAEKAYGKALRGLRREVDDVLEAAIGRVGADTDAWKAANRRFQVASVAVDFARKGMQRAAGNNPIPLTSILGAIGGGAALGSLPGGLATGAASYLMRQYGSGVAGAAARMATDALTAVAAPETVAVLASLERAGTAVNRKIDTLASTLVRAGVKAENVARTEVEAGIASEFAHRRPAGFAKEADQIRTLANDPAAMMAALNDLTDDLHEHAPETAQALGIAYVRGIQFLDSKLPKPPPRTPLGPGWQPSSAEIAKFNRYKVAVDDPLSILKQASAGTLTPEGVEAVRAVYPDVFAEMQTRVVDALTRHPDVPLRQRMMLSMLVGMDLDGSIAGLPANQATYAAPSERPGLPKPNPSASALNVASRSETPAQRAASR